MNKNQDCWYTYVCDNKCSGCIRYAEMRYLMDNSKLPLSKQVPISLIPDDIDYESFCELNDIKSEIEDFVYTGRNLYLWSTRTGNGKTSWAIKLLTKYFDKIWPGNGFRIRGLFVHVPTLLLQLKDFDNPDEQLKELLKSVDLVVWDDIASTGLSQYDLSQLLMYIDYRVMNEKSNIYTGNLNQSELTKTVGSRLASRIWNTSVTIELKGKDRR